jgi:hypothetical protein
MVISVDPKAPPTSAQSTMNKCWLMLNSIHKFSLFSFRVFSRKKYTFFFVSSSPTYLFVVFFMLYSPFNKNIVQQMFVIINLQRQSFYVPFFCFSIHLEFDFQHSRAPALPFDLKNCNHKLFDNDLIKITNSFTLAKVLQATTKLVWRRIAKRIEIILSLCCASLICLYSCLRIFMSDRIHIKRFRKKKQKGKNRSIFSELNF